VIGNSATYIRDLEYLGTSPQNTRWVQLAAQRYRYNFRKNVAALLRKGGG
jgi:hypothetical protein